MSSFSTIQRDASPTNTNSIVCGQTSGVLDLLLCAASSTSEIPDTDSHNSDTSHDSNTQDAIAEFPGLSSEDLQPERLLFGDDHERDDSSSCSSDKENQPPRFQFQVAISDSCQRLRNNCVWATEGAYGSSSDGSDVNAEGGRVSAALDVTPASREASGRAEPAELPPTLLTSTREQSKRSAQAADADADDGPVHRTARVWEGSSAFRQDEPSLQVEAWEAPAGRQTNSSGKNIGFSSRYITGTQPIQVFQDVFINIVPIAPGTSNRWPAGPDKARLFTVLSGKVAVKIDDDSFTLGLHGVWMVMPGHNPLL